MCFVNCALGGIANLFEFEFWSPPSYSGEASTKAPHISRVLVDYSIALLRFLSYSRCSCSPAVSFFFFPLLLGWGGQKAHANRSRVGEICS